MHEMKEVSTHMKNSGFIDQLQSKGTLSSLHFAVDTIGNDTTLGLELFVSGVRVRRESPLTGDDDLLTSGELVLATAKSLHGVFHGDGLGSDGQQNLVDLNASNQTLGLSEGVTHTGLESIGSGTRKHFVDTCNVVGVHTNTHVEGISSTHLLHVLVGADTGSF
jgi:hypothetical protein